MTVLNAVRLLTAYTRAKRFDRIRDRQIIEDQQQQWLVRLKEYVGRRSAYYRRWVGMPWAQWPIVGKELWMAHFDEINTVGARLEEVSAIALRAEETRDFSPQWRTYTVGMSTGTSGRRGIFLVSPAERSLWAGTLVGKLLRDGLLAQERIALVLRAGATLYDSVGKLRLRFRFFDQMRPWNELVKDLCSFEPTILVAPASVLRLLSNSACRLQPRRVISVAEVLDDLDRRQIQSHFNLTVEQIYQATEGLLGVSCEHGTVHINEPYILIEPQWQDLEHSRFVPLVTDLRRRTQPIIRYRLNDVLQTAREPCPCGRAAMALAAIEGRLDDVLWLEATGRSVPIFPDLLARVIVQSAEALQDYQVDELEQGHWRIALHPMPSIEEQQRLISQCHALATRLGAPAPGITITDLIRVPQTSKQRRIRGAHSVKCAS